MKIDGMSDEEKVTAIAKACGWRHDTWVINMHVYSKWFSPGEDLLERRGKQLNFPDYLNDLNAMHEAEKLIIEKSDGTPWPDPWAIYVACLERRCLAVHASACSRADAFLLCLPEGESK